MTFAAFIIAYPEFAPAGRSIIEAKLAEAAGRVSEEAFGSNYDTAHGLLTAHLLWISPHGATMRKDGDGNQIESRYAIEFAELRQEVVPSMLVT